MEQDNQSTLNPPASSEIENIGQRLSNQEQEKPQAHSDEPRAEQPIQFDMSKLTSEQLQSLKAQLAVTPERASRKKENPFTMLREIKGKFVTAIGKAYLTLVYDATRLAEVEAHKIPVKFNDAKEFTDILYSDFMSAERVRCEITSIRTEKNTRYEGQVVQRETGKLVDMEVTTINYFFTVKLPDGTSTEVAGEASNA